MSKSMIAIFVVALVLILGGGVFLMSQGGSSGSGDKGAVDPSLAKYLHYQKIPDLGRVHVSPPEKVKYNSNPPTSGSHYPNWQTPGILTSAPQDEYLVHSLEHGYIIISYNCAKPDPKNESCDQLKKELADLARSKRLWKLIVVPRPNLDTRIALTAWDNLDKMNSFDKDRIIAFIDHFRDKGPEQTME